MFKESRVIITMSIITVLSILIIGITMIYSLVAGTSSNSCFGGPGPNCSVSQYCYGPNGYNDSRCAGFFSPPNH